MTSSAAEMGNSGVGYGQTQGSASKETADTEDRSVSIGQYDLPGKAEHALHDNGNNGGSTITDQALNEGAESEGAFQAAGQPPLNAEQKQSTVHKSDMQAEPVSVTGNGWSAHISGTAPDMEVRQSGSMGLAAEEAVKGADGASSEPVAAAADSAAAPKRSHLSPKQVPSRCLSCGEGIRKKWPQHVMLLGDTDTSTLSTSRSRIQRRPDVSSWLRKGVHSLETMHAPHEGEARSFLCSGGWC